jgi:hypothetical protein
LAWSDVSIPAETLLGAAHPGGGWSYYPGAATSRLEPTVWAILALTAGGSAQSVGGAHRDFLVRCQRADGWLVEDMRWPVNIAFNALVAVAWLHRRDLAPDVNVQRLLAALTQSKGVRVPPSPSFAQDNSLQGWSWVDSTFSWVEPTALGTLALKKAARLGALPAATARPRIEEADRLLLDRCCRGGGWNYGNPNVMGQDLYPHVPTTALALIALQDRRGEPAVARSLTFLEKAWADEGSMIALGLSLICLSLYGRPTDKIEGRLRTHVLPLEHQTQAGAALVNAPGASLCGLAVAATALTAMDNDSAFRI